MAKKNNNGDVYHKCWAVRCREQIEAGDEEYLAQGVEYVLCEKHATEYWNKVNEWVVAYREFGDEDGNPPIGYKTELQGGTSLLWFAYPLPDELLNLRVPSELKGAIRAARKWRPEGAEKIEFEIN